MPKLVALSILSTLWVAPAFADSKSDAQAKVDAAKTETCEKAKKFLADQETKGKCKAESADAKKITCSAATAKSVTDLQTRCITAKPAAADPKPEPAAIPHCRAVDPKDAKHVFEEAEDPAATKCTSLLLPKLQTHFCSDAANKGKSFDYVADFDHVVGGKKLATAKKQLKCPRK
jgi:hypothetical protein